jgi:hypothetical protein
MKVKFIKALMTLISVLMSYKIIKFLWYFNKAIIYVLGLIFIGFNWSDYRIITEIKLIYDSIILWFISFTPNNPISYDIKNKVEEDMKEIMRIDNLKKHTTLEKAQEEYKQFIIADKLKDVKSLRNEIKNENTFISDGVEVYTWEEIFSNWRKLMFFTTCILITGTFIIYKFDIDVADWSVWSWSHIKTGFWATLYFLKRLYDWFKRGGPGNPPMSPSGRIPTNPPIEVNPALTQLENEVASTSYNVSKVDSIVSDLTYLTRDEGINPNIIDPNPVFIEQSEDNTSESSTETITPTLGKGKNPEKIVRFNIGALERKYRKIEANVDDKHHLYEDIEDNYSEALDKLNKEIQDLYKIDSMDTLEREKLIYNKYQLLFKIYDEHYPKLKSFSSLEFSPTTYEGTPIKSPVNIEGLSLDNFTDE